jgi:hypothetical protein
MVDLISRPEKRITIIIKKRGEKEGNRKTNRNNTNALKINSEGGADKPKPTHIGSRDLPDTYTSKPNEVRTEAVPPPSAQVTQL